MDLKAFRPCGPDIGCPRGVRSATSLAALASLRACRQRATVEATAQCIGALPLMKGVSPSDLHLLALSARVHRVERGAPAVMTGQHLAIVVSGLLQVSVADADRRQPVYLVGPGQLCGEQDVLRAARHDHAVEAVERSDVLLIRAEAFLSVAQRSPALMRRLARILSARILHVTDTIEMMTRRSASERVAAFLLCLSRCDAVAHKMGYLVLPVRKRIVAALLDVSSESLSRILSRFQALGMIEQSGLMVRVLDREGLERQAFAAAA
jgi:CRP/FNR family transcriptional regulator